MISDIGDSFRFLLRELDMECMSGLPKLMSMHVG